MHRTAFSRPSSRRESTRMHAALLMWVCLGAVSVVGTLPASAAFLPAPVSIPPGLAANRNGLSATQVIVSGFAHTGATLDNVNPIAALDSFSMTNRNYLCDQSGTTCNPDAISTNDSKVARVEINGHGASARASGVAAPGQLKALSSASVARPDIRGNSFSEARVEATFTDVIFVQGNGGLPDTATGITFNPLVVTSGSTAVDGNAIGGASYDFFLWIFGYEPTRTFEQDAILAARQGEYFLGQSGNSFGTANRVEIGSLESLRSGQAYWVHALLRTGAGANSFAPTSGPVFGSATADYSHTINFYLDPSATNPLATYTTASGTSYRSATPPDVNVAAPSAGSLFAGAWLLAAVARSRVRRRNGCAGRVARELPADQGAPTARCALG